MPTKKMPSRAWLACWIPQTLPFLPLWGSTRVRVSGSLCAHTWGHLQQNESFSYQFWSEFLGPRHHLHLASLTSVLRWATRGFLGHRASLEAWRIVCPFGKSLKFQSFPSSISSPAHAAARATATSARIASIPPLAKDLPSPIYNIEMGLRVRIPTPGACRGLLITVGLVGEEEWDADEG